MAVNYNDKRFTEVNKQKNQALTELENTYSGMINNSDKYYQAQIDASKQWANTQSEIQKQETEFAIQQVEQQKQQTEKDYTREQSGAYVDWQKQSSQHGVQAEQKASQGLQNTGYSESSQVSMYNTYQNRVATARESYNKAVQNYDNSITQARLQNNAKLAEIAYQALQNQLELSLQGFQYKNQLVLEKANKKTELENQYYQRYQNVLQQINTENALAEQIRQYNKSYALQEKQLAEQKRQFNIQQAKSSSGGGGGGGSSRSYSSSYKSSGGGAKNAKKTSKAKNGKKETIGDMVKKNHIPTKVTYKGKNYGTATKAYTIQKGKKVEIKVKVNGKVANVYQTANGDRWYWDTKKGQYQLIAKKPTTKTPLSKMII